MIRCRVCGLGEVESLGQIPDNGKFAGQLVTPSIKGGQLLLCKDCGSMFRHPTLSASDYIMLYEKSPSTVWVDPDIERYDLVAIYKYLKYHAGGSILDIGCYTGIFLSGLPDKFQKYGLEPSSLASGSAVSKGIDVLGKTLDDLDTDIFFDVVVSIDVIEHVIDVENFLNQALAHVKETGLLIISTGNPGCFFWRRIYKSMFWYSYFVEHVTFPSYKYYNKFAICNGLQPPEQICLSYKKLKLPIKLFMLLRSFLFSLSPGLYQALRNFRRVIMGSTIANSLDFPIITAGVFRDHHVIIIKKGSK
jgi:SAM-dependent methyltransferase